MDIEPEGAPAPVAKALPGSPRESRLPTPVLAASTLTAKDAAAQDTANEVDAWPRWLPRLLGYFIAVGPAATDMYLPTFPAVEASFHTAPGTAQLTLAAWFAGLAVGQIMQGTLSDRLGRRRPLIIGFT